MPEPRKLRVFLCHASQDKPVVRELYQKLLAEGWIDPWLDKEKLLPGQDWELEIEKSVEKADVVIVCLSKSSVEKEGYYQKEIKKVLDVADEKPESTIFIVPLRLDNCQPSRRLLKWQYEDYFPATNRNEAYARLLQSLTSRAKSLGIELKQSVLDSIQAIPVLINYPPSMESENVLGKLVHDVVFHDSTTDCMTVIKHALEQTASPLFFPRLFVLSDNKRNAIHLFEGGGELGEPVSFVRGTIEVIPYPGNLSKVCVYSDSLEDDRDKWMLDRWSAIRVKLENDGWRFTNARNFA